MKENAFKRIIKSQTFLYILAAITAALMLALAIMFDQSIVMLSPFLISLVVRILHSRANRLGHLIGGFNAIIYGFIYLSYRLYGSMFNVFLISAPMQLLTFFVWSKNPHKKTTVFRTMSKKLRLLLTFAGVVAYVIYTSYVFKNVGDANAVFFDSAILIVGAFSPWITLLAFREYVYLNLLKIVLELIVYVQMIALGAEEMSSYLVFTVYALICILIQVSNVNEYAREQQNSLGENKPVAEEK